MLCHLDRANHAAVLRAHALVGHVEDLGLLHEGGRICRLVVELLERAQGLGDSGLRILGILDRDCVLRLLLLAAVDGLGNGSIEVSHGLGKISDVLLLNNEMAPVIREQKKQPGDQDIIGQEDGNTIHEQEEMFTIEKKMSEVEAEGKTIVQLGIQDTESLKNEQLAANIDRDFSITFCRSHTSTSILQGTVIVTCKDNGVQLKARLAWFEDFHQISQEFTDQEVVSRGK